MSWIQNDYMLIKIHRISNDGGPVLYDKGDWTGLTIQKDTVFPKWKVMVVPLGIKMDIPKGFEADIKITDGASQKYRIMQPSGIQTVSSGYNKEISIMLVNTGYTIKIKKGMKICRFKIIPTQHATFMQKMKWLFDGIPHYKYI